MIAFIDTASTAGKDNDEEARDNEYVEVIEELEKQNKRIVKLMSLMEFVDKKIKFSPDYIKRTLHDKGKDDFSIGDMPQSNMS